jgi:hypothetical protein
VKSAIGLVTIWLLLWVAIWSEVAEAFPQLQQSAEGYSRIINYDNVAYLCWINFYRGYGVERVLYPGQATPWYPTNDIVEWGCR